MAASGSLVLLKTPKLMAMAHMRRPSGPPGCGKARWLASASSRVLRSLASVALATAFSMAKVMDGPLEVWAMFLAMKFSLLPEPVHVSVSAGWSPSLYMSVAHFMTCCILAFLIDWYLPSLVAQPTPYEYSRLCMTP